MKKKILLVDDDGLITQTYTYILKQNGYEAESLNSLKEIKSLINEWTPDIIILDVKIGNKNSIDFLPELKR
ncbi:response regulator [Bacteroides fragilis]|nr:response regulator [Bacteroides fragilis]